MALRIVSLVPSGTETLLSLGAPVTACTRFCEQPGIPHVGGTKNPDIDAIIELDPDFVVMDREENRREDADALVAAGIDLFVSDVTTVDAAERFVVDLAARVVDRGRQRRRQWQWRRLVRPRSCRSGAVRGCRSTG